ncbi:MAG: NUDIX domain-containing protein [bacterium]|nr:NUDIX domain-containing protein [bacterium]
MENPQNKIYFGIYGLFPRDGKILVIKKARGPYIGKYDLPGGGRQPNETIIDCLKRELKEETNADLLSETFIGMNVYRCQYQKESGEVVDFCHVGFYYSVDLEITDIKSAADGEDSNGAVFVPIAELMEENTAPIAWPMIQKYLESL